VRTSALCCEAWIGNPLIEFGGKLQLRWSSRPRSTDKGLCRKRPETYVVAAARSVARSARPCDAQLELGDGCSTLLELLRRIRDAIHLCGTAQIHKAPL
jgi:hypothetical protein